MVKSKSKTGSCLCGAVKYRVKSDVSEASACHCGICRKWSGGIFMAFEVVAGDIEFVGRDNIACYASSDWAERGFCRMCGSSLYCRITAEGPHQGQYHLGMGTLDDTAGVALTSEIFTDEKPDGYGFAGDLPGMTGPQVIAMFAPDADQK